MATQSVDQILNAISTAQRRQSAVNVINGIWVCCVQWQFDAITLSQSQKVVNARRATGDMIQRGRGKRVLTAFERNVEESAFVRVLKYFKKNLEREHIKTFPKNVYPAPINQRSWRRHWFRNSWMIKSVALSVTVAVMIIVILFFWERGTAQRRTTCSSPFTELVTSPVFTHPQITGVLIYQVCLKYSNTWLTDSLCDSSSWSHK